MPSFSGITEKKLLSASFKSYDLDWHEKKVHKEEILDTLTKDFGTLIKTVTQVKSQFRPVIGHLPKVQNWLDDNINNTKTSLSKIFIPDFNLSPTDQRSLEFKENDEDLVEINIESDKGERCVDIKNDSNNDLSKAAIYDSNTLLNKLLSADELDMYTRLNSEEELIKYYQNREEDILTMSSEFTSYLSNNIIQAVDDILEETSLLDEEYKNLISSNNL